MNITKRRFKRGKYKILKSGEYNIIEVDDEKLIIMLNDIWKYIKELRREIDKIKKRLD